MDFQLRFVFQPIPCSCLDLTPRSVVDIVKSQRALE